MADIAWLIRRFRAMSAPEIVWRLSQKLIQKDEEKRFKSNKSAVTDFLFNSKLGELQLDAKRMHLNMDNERYSLGTDILLLGEYDYESYKKKWNAGFQTENTWPDTFAYNMEYKQRDDIGDARTNWELNRHFQFALLAKDYAASGDVKFLHELEDLFDDWNKNNAFLWGISWTSVMEVAIRCSNWCYTYCFLDKTGAPKKMLDKIRIGILNMTDYISNHYSRYSSANNHLIVEAYAIGQTGILFNYEPWIDLAVEILTHELPLQNYSDGINKELSLHYQSFYMEAMGLMMRLMIKNNIKVPDSWAPMLKKMCHYVSACMGNYGEIIEFGDNDEGKILDLGGGLNHYKYVLGLFSFMLDERYVDNNELQENLNWLFSGADVESVEKKSLYKVNESICFKEGGNSILRSKDGRVLIGIDHAALGFGSIAAHGHADALSFQMFVDGQPIFIDPGTYIYHCKLEKRNEYRKTKNHNTINIDNRDQSEMLGAFLWGRKAECKLLNSADGMIEAEHNGYDVSVKRKYEFNGKRLLITDTIGGVGEAVFMLSPEAVVSINDNVVRISVGNVAVKMTTSSEVVTKDIRMSSEYGKEKKSKALVVPIEKTLATDIEIEE